MLPRRCRSMVQEFQDTSWVGATLGINGIHPPTAAHWHMLGTWRLHHLVDSTAWTPVRVRGLTCG